MVRSRSINGKQVLKKFGARVREYRKGKKWSQEHLALDCGLDRTYIGGVERGERNISLINICKIAKSLKVGLPDLLAVKI